MPTTQEEAQKILEISQSYVSIQKLQKIFTKLHEEVGQHTENSSLKISLEMMKNLMDSVPPGPPDWIQPTFYAVVIVHALLVFAEALAFILLPFLAPWYVALPCMTFIFFFTTNRVECKITNLENELRDKLGLPRIRGFVGHYFMPIIWNAVDQVKTALGKVS